VIELRAGRKDVRRPAELSYAYIVFSLLAGIHTEEARARHWAHVDWTATPPPTRPSRRTWPSGDQSTGTGTATPKPNDHSIRV
jgi:hypothetical protein